MKKILTIAAAFVTMFASAQIKMPAPSTTQKINQETSEFGSAYPFAFFIRNEVGEIIAGCNGSVVFGAVSIQINYGSAQIIVDLVWA